MKKLQVGIQGVAGSSMKRSEQMLSLNRRFEELGTACSDGETGVAVVKMKRWIPDLGGGMRAAKEGGGRSGRGR
jgi:hypothetical protein